MRIIAGKYKGRKLITPTGRDIRPTSDRTREAMFNLLMHGAYAGEAVVDQHVVDLCCGTGALGLEALSRGARMATFVDQDKRSLELTRQNVTHCGANAVAQCVQADAARLPTAREPAALVLMDPPYATPIVAAAYAALMRGGWVQHRSLIVCEQSRDMEAPELEHATLVDARQYGKAKVLVYRVTIG